MRFYIVELISIFKTPEFKIPLKKEVQFKIYTMDNKAESNQGKGSKSIPDSSSKKATGSKSVHSELDQSKEDGFQHKDNRTEEE